MAEEELTYYDARSAGRIMEAAALPLSGSTDEAAAFIDHGWPT